jgi:hypothetical protein
MSAAASQLRRTEAKPAPTFTGYEDFVPAFNVARRALIAEVGINWHLHPEYYVWARLPIMWVQVRVASPTPADELHERWSVSPRDHRLPIGRFWPSGSMPHGPEYAEATS